MKNLNEFYLQFRYNIPIFLAGFCTSWMPDNRISIRLRGFFYSFFIKSCGKNFTVGRDVTLLNPYNLYIGDNVYIAKGCWLNAMGGISLDNEVVLGPYVVMSSLQHTFKNYSVQQGGSIAGPINIGRGTWIASHASVKCNVSVGRGNLIAANTFVNSNTPDYKIIGGVPGRVIGDVKNGGQAFYTRKQFMRKS